MGTLNGRTALVTGASRGIGRAIARRLAAEGALVAVHYGSDDAAAKETVELITDAGGRAVDQRPEHRRHRRFAPLSPPGSGTGAGGRRCYARRRRAPPQTTGARSLILTGHGGGSRRRPPGVPVRSTTLRTARCRHEGVGERGLKSGSGT